MPGRIKKNDTGWISSNCLEEEVLEEVGGVDDGEHQDGGKVDGEDCVEETSLEHHRHLQASVCVARVLVRQSPVISMSAASSILTFGRAGISFTTDRKVTKCTSW